MNTCLSEERCSLRAMVVDDNVMDRARLKRLLADIDRISVVAEAADVHETIGKLKKISVDVIFLDVHMPDATGLALAKALQAFPAAPAIVFASAHAEYALEAFEASAVDYLTKPVQPERLAMAVERAREQVSFRTFRRKHERIPIETGSKKVFIPVVDIRFAMAHADCAYLQTSAKRYFVAESLAHLERALRNYGFFRVHRSFLVNLDQIEEVEPHSGGTMTLTLNGVGDKIPVSRRRASEFKTTMGV